MILRWSPTAAKDFVRIIEYIRRENPAAAQRIAKKIHERAVSLKSYPLLGKIGRVEGTRELVVPALPFVIVYRVIDEWVEIANVVHGAQRWPPEE